MSQFDQVFELSYATAAAQQTTHLAPRLSAPENVVYRITYWGDITFVIDGAGHRIWLVCPNPDQFEHAMGYLYGPVIGFTLRLRGAFCLHASVVEIDGAAVALMAPSGGGKSTTAAALCARGHALVSDDILVLRFEGNLCYAEPGFPWLRLCDSALEVLESVSGNRLHVQKQGDKLVLPLPQQNYQLIENPLPVAALYTMTSSTGKTGAHALSGADGMMVVLANTYPSFYYRLHPHNRSGELGLASRLMQRVSVRGLSYERQLDQLDALCDLLENDVAQVRQSASVHTPVQA
ncbi:MAG: hypothetical protein AAGI44_05580 [Pseudomonadota bacterium]